MLLAMIIVGGVVASTLIAALFDYLGKRAKTTNPDLEKRIADLENRQNLLETAVLDKDEKINLLSKEITFVNKLLEDRTKD